MRRAPLPARGSRPGGRLALLAVGVLGAAVLAESAARVHQGTTVYVDDGRRYATRPGTRGTNRWGFHERDLPPIAAPGARRVAVLGDSMTWGTATAAETWTRAAEATLGPPWEVLNFSHYGYDAEQCAAVLRHHAARWAPEVVVYAAYGNDLVPTRHITVGEPPMLVRVDAEGGWLPAPLLGSSFLRLVEGATLRAGLAEVEDPARLRAGLVALAEAASDLHASVLVWVQVPHVLAGPDPDALLDQPGFAAAALDRARRVEAEARSLGLEVASAAPWLRGSGRVAFFPPGSVDPEHPGPDGHAVLGAAFADLLGRFEAGEPLPGLDHPPISP